MDTLAVGSISADFLYLAPLPECSHSYIFMDKAHKWGQCSKCLIVRDFGLEMYLCSFCGNPSQIVTSYNSPCGYVHLGSCCFDPLVVHAELVVATPVQQ
jgi:hypothetical protein